MLSQQVIGIDQIPNPEINRIEAELRRAEQDYLIAERKFGWGWSDLGPAECAMAACFASRKQIRISASA